MDSRQAARRATAAVALGLGLGLAVIAAPAVACAADTESPPPPRGGGSAVQEGHGPARPPRNSAAKRRQVAKTANRSAAAARPTVVEARVRRKFHAPDCTLPETVTRPPGPNIVVVPAGETRIAPAARPTAPVPGPVIGRPAVMRAGVTSAPLPAATGPAGAAARTAIRPFDTLTAALELISREISRLLSNRAPTAQPVLYTLSTPAVATGTIGGVDPDGDPLSYSIAAPPTHGTVVVDKFGVFAYTAGAQFAQTGGTDTFTVTLRDRGLHLNWWVPRSITVPVSVTVPAASISDPAAAEGNGAPALSISNASVSEPTGGAIAPGFLHTSGSQIVDSSGRPVRLSGVNWFGMESPTAAPHGLWIRSYRDMIDQMAAAGFNTIRLPFAGEMLRTSAAPNGIDFTKNPELQGLTSVAIMDAIVDYAGQQGMRVILDHHRGNYGSGTSGNGLWYDDYYTEDTWVSDWAALAARYRDNATVIGVDLHNEPYSGTWGGGGADDWARAAERAGNAVLAVNPNLLVIVEGVGSYQGDSYWWGGQLQGVRDRPIALTVPNRVVYSPHDYPNSVYPQSWFQGADFGAGLPEEFRTQWGYIAEQNIAPIYLGEFGTQLSDPKDVIWLEALTSYIADMSWTYWAWNPNSGDTGGILADDWATINAGKMAYLTPIEFSAGDSPAPATFTISLSAPSAQQISVQYATMDDTAVAGSDYMPVAGTVVFAPGETRKTVTVLVPSDSIVEPVETFHIVLSNASGGAALTDATGVGAITDRSPARVPASDPVPPPAAETYVDLMTFGTFHGSSHTGMETLAGGRTAITTEALVAYNALRTFTGLAPATLENVGMWAFAHNMTNNPQPWDNDLQGVGLYYAMQGAKAGWIADDRYSPQIVADIERTARLGSPDEVMAMVARYGHDGFARYLMDNGYQTAFINALKMEPHYAGWMHDRANGRLVIEGTATAHDLNHLTVLSHDQMRPFMNDTWDWPQWPALEVSAPRVIEYFQSMVALA